jgi:hypothetical protein
MTDREYGNLSDFLFEHEQQIRAEYVGVPSESFMWNYTRYTPEITFLLAVMAAVRGLPGLDRFTGPNTFTEEIEHAWATYRRDVVQDSLQLQEVSDIETASGPTPVVGDNDAESDEG